MAEQFTTGTHNESDRFLVRTTADSPNSQFTKKGHEIPVPSKSQVMRDFTKIATARHDDEDDGEDQS